MGEFLFCAIFGSDALGEGWQREDKQEGGGMKNRSWCKDRERTGGVMKCIVLLSLLLISQIGSVRLQELKRSFP